MHVLPHVAGVVEVLEVEHDEVEVVRLFLEQRFYPLQREPLVRQAQVRLVPLLLQAHGLDVAAVVVDEPEELAVLHDLLGEHLEVEEVPDLPWHLQVRDHLEEGEDTTEQGDLEAAAQVVDGQEEAGSGRRPPPEPHALRGRVAAEGKNPVHAGEEVGGEEDGEVLGVGPLDGLGDGFHQLQAQDYEAVRVVGGEGGGKQRLHHLEEVKAALQDVVAFEHARLARDQVLDRLALALAHELEEAEDEDGEAGLAVLRLDDIGLVGCVCPGSLELVNDLHPLHLVGDRVPLEVLHRADGGVEDLEDAGEEEVALILRQEGGDRVLDAEVLALEEDH
mmetsp:Transcript_17701/g.40032  ORF Transcript_17701/g.40032 Transcript_17701/m.40032 type:complete len:334 (+) Transcript_17701:1910-2911(+)